MRSSTEPDALRRPPRRLGTPVLVDVEFHPVKARVSAGPDGIIGADQGTHGTADAGIFHPGLLADAVKGIIAVGMLCVFGHRCFDDPFLERMKGDGLDRANRRTLAA